jgi:hypothetical protein
VLVVVVVLRKLMLHGGDLLCNILEQKIDKPDIWMRDGSARIEDAREASGHEQWIFR